MEGGVESLERHGVEEVNSGLVCALTFSDVVIIGSHATYTNLLIPTA